MDKIMFPVDSCQLHNEPNFNYQLNRTALWGGGDIDEIRAAAPKIVTTGDWERELIALGDNALKESRTTNAIAYYRMAEFFMFDANPRKMEVYRKSKELFYEYHKAVFDSGEVRRDEVPFESGKLPVWICLPKGEAKGTVLLHGGYDSYMEEFLGVARYVVAHGFALYLFEGLGQGAALREHSLHFTKDWHKPVAAILDRYGLNDVTLVGISLGAVLAPRAAAYERRVTRVVAHSILPNFLDVVMSTRPPFIRNAVRAMLTLRLAPLVNALSQALMKKDQMMNWGISHGMYAFGVKSPYEFLRTITQYQFADVGSKIEQDFLLIGAERDHFIPKAFYKAVIDELPNVRSLCYRLFTHKENAETHCNAGNMRLVLDFICGWIDGVTGAGREVGE